MPKYLSSSMTCIPLLFMRVLLMFYRSTMLIITHVFLLFYRCRIVCVIYIVYVCGTNMKGNLYTACIHTEVCVFLFFRIFYSMHFSYSSDILLFSFSLSLSLSLPLTFPPSRPIYLSLCVIVVAS